jgi:integrase
MLKLTRRGTTWHITGTLRGIRVRESTGTASKPHAEAVRAQREKEILDRSVYGEAVTATFAEAVNLYLDLGGSPRFLEPLVERWGAWRLQRITPLEVARAARDIYPDSAASTRKRQIYTPVTAVLNAAADAGLCTVPKLKPPKVKQPKVEAPDDAWIAALLAACGRPWPDGSPGQAKAAEARERLRGIVLYMTLTGARVSEATALRWRDVDLDRKTALLPHTKSGEPRLTVLPPDAEAAIQALRRRQGSRGAVDPDARVFGYAARYSVRQALERAADAASLPRFSPHQVGRHAFAQRMLADGATLAEVAEAGGWADVKVVAQFYGHLERKTVNQAVVAAGNKLTQAIRETDSNVLIFKGKA